LSLKTYQGLTAESLRTIKENIGKAMITIYGICSAKFEGSAASLIGNGSRALIIKKDKVVLLHGLEGMKPINWQGKGSFITIKALNEKLIIRAESRSKRGAFIEITFQKVENITIYSGEKGEKINLIGSEEHLVNFLISHPDLIEPGFKVLTRERETEFGYIDIIGLDHKGHLTIIEVKRRTAGTKDIQQLRRYVEALSEKKKMNVRGIIVAPAIGSKAQKFLNSFNFEFKKINLDKIIYQLKNKKPTMSLDNYFED